jgi:hypothetical protein
MRRILETRAKTAPTDNSATPILNPGSEHLQHGTEALHLGLQKVVEKGLAILGPDCTTGLRRMICFFARVC